MNILRIAVTDDFLERKKCKNWSWKHKIIKWKYLNTKSLFKILLRVKVQLLNVHEYLHWCLLSFFIFLIGYLIIDSLCWKEKRISLNIITNLKMNYSKLVSVGLFCFVSASLVVFSLPVEGVPHCLSKDDIHPGFCRQCQKGYILD